MKHMIYCVIGHSTITDEILSSLSDAGYKGTVIPSTSLRKTLLNDGEAPMFFNLSNFDVDNYENNTTIIIVEEENKVDEIFDIIREHTGNWKDVNGCVFSVPLKHFEGSF